MISKNCEQIQKFVHTFIAIILIQICFQNDGFGFGFGVFLKNEKKSGFVFGTLKMNVNIPNECKKRPHKQGDVLIQFGIRIVILQSSYIV